MTTFKDNFSKQSDLYAKYRPHYPPELFSYLASLSKEHDLVWDCGTGNGQAAVGLAEHFKKVIATDPSAEQIKNAIPHGKVRYAVEKAESTSLETGSADLLTIANALHWFDFDAFYKEAKRVLKPGGILAAWCYEVPKISPPIDKLLRHYHDHVLNDYWLPENRLVEKEYTTIPFPFKEISGPQFFSEKKMKLADLEGYLNTWSATQRFIRENQFNPLAMIMEGLKGSWRDAASEKTVTWKLVLKVGKV